MRTMAGPNAIKAAVLKFMTDVLGFPADAAKSLYTTQLLQTSDVLEKLDNPQVEQICMMIRKPGGIGAGHSTPMIAIKKMKLLVFFLKLLSRTSHRLPYLHTIRLDHFEDLTDQKALEVSYLK